MARASRDDGVGASPRPPGHRQRLGARGERLAADWYRVHGYELVARNWRCREGELDLVVARPGELVFCEVKSRSSDRFGVPAEAVTPAKQARLRVLAARFLAEHTSDGRRGWSLRFDVAAVTGGRVEVIEAAF
jgi:putative endonuclease